MPSVGAVALAIISASVTARRATFPVANETGAFADAPAVAAYLQQQVGSGDVILARVPANVPLYYYLSLRSGPAGRISLPPTEAVHRGMASAARVFLVVNGPLETLEDVEAEMMSVTQSFTPARLVSTFPQASVYVRDRP